MSMFSNFFLKNIVKFTSIIRLNLKVFTFFLRSEDESTLKTQLAKTYFFNMLNYARKINKEVTEFRTSRQQISGMKGKALPPKTGDLFYAKQYGSETHRFYNKEYDKMSLIAYLIAHGISVPHYCYHNELAIVGNCRMCVVELESAKKPVISCTSDAVVGSTLKENGVIFDSPLVLTARESVMEFLLLNHPLDCPICDQGGDCDLQDQSLLFGSMRRRFYTDKRVVLDKNLGPIVKTVMTRCIHCTRCVRFITDITGFEELGMLGRGGGSEIGTFVEKPLLSELSGNIIDLCPVGSLTLINFIYKK